MKCAVSSTWPFEVHYLIILDITEVHNFIVDIPDGLYCFNFLHSISALPLYRGHSSSAQLLHRGHLRNDLFLSQKFQKCTTSSSWTLQDVHNFFLVGIPDVHNFFIVGILEVYHFYFVEVVHTSSLHTSSLHTSSL